MNGNPVYQWYSALLCYPEADLLDALPEFQAALAEWPELKAEQSRLKPFLDYLAEHTIRQLQEAYVNTFDRNRNHALYIFEHVYGEDRNRGSAMVDLLEEYRSHGFELGDEELPDYIPALLEYLSQVSPEHAIDLLDGAVHVLAHIGKNLEKADSPYAALLQGVTALSRVEPQPLVEPPVRDMDEAMEIFGPDAAGVEPLLKPSIETIQFYPKSAFQTASKGV